MPSATVRIEVILFFLRFSALDADDILPIY